MSEKAYKNENEELKFKLYYAEVVLTRIIDDLIDYNMKTPFSLKEKKAINSINNVIESLYNLEIYLGEYK